MRHKDTKVNPDIENRMLSLLKEIATGGRPDQNKFHDRHAMYFMKLWGLVRTRIKSNKWEVTSAGYQWLKSESISTKEVVTIETAQTALEAARRRLAYLGDHAEDCEDAVRDVTRSIKTLTAHLDMIGDRYMALDRREAGLGPLLD